MPTPSVTEGMKRVRAEMKKSMTHASNLHKAHNDKDAVRVINDAMKVYDKEMGKLMKGVGPKSPLQKTLADERTHMLATRDRFQRGMVVNSVKTEKTALRVTHPSMADMTEAKRLHMHLKEAGGHQRVKMFVKVLNEMGPTHPHIQKLVKQLEEHSKALGAGKMDVETFKKSCKSDLKACKKEVDGMLSKSRGPRTVLEYIHEAIRHLFKILDYLVTGAFTLGKKTAMEKTPLAQRLHGKDHFFNPLQQDTKLGTEVKGFEKALDCLKEEGHDAKVKHGHK